MSLESILIAEPQKGLQKNKKPFLILDSAFQQLENAYVWRDSTVKRKGIKLIGRLRRSLTSQSLGTTTAGTTTNIADIFTTLSLRANEPHAVIEQESLVITVAAPDTATFTDQGDGTFAVTGAGVAAGSYVNYATGEVNLVFSGASPGGTAITADFAYFPSLPVMGIDLRETALINNEDTICFDTIYAYSYNGNDFVEMSSTTPTTWTGQNYDFFWCTNYRGSDPNSRLFFATNSNKSDTIRYHDGVTWTDFTPTITGLASTSFTQTTLTTVAFTGTLNNLPLITKTLSITITSGADVRIFVDELGTGVLTGYPSTNSGTVNYTTGAISLTFSPAFAGVPTEVTMQYQYQNEIMTDALILLPYYGRLIALNTWEGTNAIAATNFFNRCRFSQIGNPIQDDAWVSTTFGKGGFIDAPVNEAIVSARFYKNTLIVQFERSTWNLRYLGEYGTPFLWERISSDFGSDSTFSTILFDDGILAVADKAIVASSGNEVQRIDLDIPDTVFEFNNDNEGKKRVQGARDFQKEIVYWCYSDGGLNEIFPNRTLLFNYRNQTWATLRDNVTTFGILSTPTGLSWDTDTLWDTDTSWDDEFPKEFPSVISGNQQGYIHFYNYSEDFEAAADNTTDMIETPSLYITDITRSTTQSLQITVPDHNLEDLEIIYITGLQFLDTSNSTVITTDLNDRFYQIEKIDDDTLRLLYWDQVNKKFLSSSGTNMGYTPEAGSGSYIGCGEVTLMPRMSIITKDINPYQKIGKQIHLSYLDVQADRSNNAAITINLLENSITSVKGNVMIGNQQLATATSMYGNIQGASQTDPCVITSSNHCLKTGNTIDISEVLGMTELNGIDLQPITFIDLNHFSLDGMDSTAFTAYTRGGKWIRNQNIFNYTEDASYAWFRFWAQVFGQYVAVQITYDDELMAQKETHQDPAFSMNALNIFARPGGRLT